MCRWTGLQIIWLEVKGETKAQARIWSRSCWAPSANCATKISSMRILFRLKTITRLRSAAAKIKLLYPLLRRKRPQKINKIEIDQLRCLRVQMPLIINNCYSLKLLHYFHRKCEIPSLNKDPRRRLLLRKRKIHWQRGILISRLLNKKKTQRFNLSLRKPWRVFKRCFNQHQIYSNHQHRSSLPESLTQIRSSYLSHA